MIDNSSGIRIEKRVDEPINQFFNNIFQKWQG